MLRTGTLGSIATELKGALLTRGCLVQKSTVLNQMICSRRVWEPSSLRSCITFLVLILFVPRVVVKSRKVVFTADDAVGT